MSKKVQTERTVGIGTAPGGMMSSGSAYFAVLSASLLAVVWAVAMLTSAGRVAYGYVYYFMEFYAGVGVLVFYSIAAMGGLVCTDRSMLPIRFRVLIQSAHRTMALAAVAFLPIHIMTKVGVGKAAPINAFVPFIAGRTDVQVGLGIVSAYLLVSIVGTGLFRARFIGVGPAWMWRAVHALAYLGWPIGIVHGLTAGRPAKLWVNLSYIFCVIFVVVGLLLRLSAELARRKGAGTTTTGGTMAPVGRAVPLAPAPRSGRRGGGSARSGVRGVPLEMVVSGPPAEEAVIELSAQMQEAPMSAIPTSPAVGVPSAVPTSPAGRQRRRVAVDEYEDEQYAPPRRRPKYQDEYDEFRPEEDPIDQSGYADYGPYERPRRSRAQQEDYTEYAPRWEEEYAPRRSADEYATRRAAEEYAPRRSEEEYRPRRSEEEYAPRRSAERYDYAPSRSVEDYGPRPDEYVPRRSAEDRGAAWREPADGYAEPRGRRAAPEYEPEPSWTRPSGEYAEAGRARRRFTTDSPAEPTWRGPSAAYPTVEPNRWSSAPDERSWGRAAVDYPSDPSWRRSDYSDPYSSAYLPPDDTPTLIDMASARARRAGTGAPASRARRRRHAEELAEEARWTGRLRGEAQ